MELDLDNVNVNHKLSRKERERVRETTLFSDRGRTEEMGEEGKFKTEKSKQYGPWIIFWRETPSSLILEK